MGKVCPPVAPSDRIGMKVAEDEPVSDDWKKLSAVHCQATHSFLTFLCSLDSRSRKVKGREEDLILCMNEVKLMSLLYSIVVRPL